MSELGICGGTGTVLCRFSADKDSIAVSKVGKRLHVLVNNRAVMSSKVDEFMSRTAPVVSMIINKMCESNNIPRLKLAAKKGELSDFLKMVKQNKNPIEVSVLQDQPDEHQENAPETRAASIPYDSYQKHMGEVSRNIVDLRHSSGILLRTNLAKEMWGSKEVSAVFNDVRSSFNKSEEVAATIDARMERMGSDVRLMRNGMHDDRMQVKARETASRMLDNFSIVKGYMSEAAQSLYPLYDIDRTFKAHTGYPATWFLMSSILMDFMYEYETLLSNMMRTAEFESSAMEPILVWKLIGAPQNV